jgi:heat shock protein HspQ
MKVQIKNEKHQPKAIKSLFNYFQSINHYQVWEYNGLIVELDPTFDFKGNDALIRWRDIQEGFNDKLIVNSLEEFQLNFRLYDA